MFESLTGRLGDVFDRLRKRGALSEADVKAAMREIRIALLEADVALPVVKSFIDKATNAAIGQEVLRSVSPGQQVIKIVHDQLVDMLGREPAELNVRGNPPQVVMMVGLQGSGKTTSTGKLGLRLKTRDKRKVLMVSVDVHRPAAIQQLQQLGQQTGLDVVPPIFGEMPTAIAKRALDSARKGGYDVLMVDTAGRLTIDEAMMQEAAQVREVVQPSEVLLVADAMTGQDAVQIAETFHKRLGVTGIMLTRVDGDARGGAALSMRAVTGQPIKFLGVGEKMDALDVFHPDRIAGRILGMGDVVSLVEKAAETIEQAEAEKLAKKVQKGRFDLEDLLSQLRQMKRMGGLGGLMSLLPQMGKMKQAMADAKIDEKLLAHQEAIILSMTPQERRRPEIIKASRKRRIAAGCGLDVQQVNKLLKQYDQMQQMMKKMKKGGGKGLAGLLGGMGGGGMPPGGMPPLGGGGLPPMGGGGGLPPFGR
ncbi:MAG: signal recognition particle protein [Alphaproteobacteria bacterium]|nr:signal recognition particle protein [Alphaproteobacteria bacterium]MCB9928289.1 signal recognition particle protein [Alphaproteobacteria bacterium]